MCQKNISWSEVFCIGTLSDLGTLYVYLMNSETWKSNSNKHILEYGSRTVFFLSHLMVHFFPSSNFPVRISLHYYFETCSGIHPWPFQPSGRILTSPFSILVWRSSLLLDVLGQSSHVDLLFTDGMSSLCLALLHWCVSFLMCSCAGLWLLHSFI